MTHEERIDGLKLLAALLPNQSDRIACMTAWISLRAQQLAAEVRKPPPMEVR